jgi:hypothetical protein
MFVWCAVLFGLGILAFADSIFNMGDIFRTINSVVFMLLSLGLLVRTTTKAKEKRVEKLEEKIFHLEQEINVLKQGQRALKNY